MSRFMLIAPYFKGNEKIGKVNGVTYNKTVKELGNLFTKQGTGYIMKSRAFYCKVSELEVEYNVEVQSYQLYAPNSTQKTGFRHFHGGDGGVTIKAHLITFDRDKTDGAKDINWLKRYFLEERTINITIDTEAVPNGLYDISKFDGFTLLRKGVYEFDIELTTHTDINTKIVNKKSVLQTTFTQKCQNRPSKKHRKSYTAKQIKKGKAEKVQCIEYVNKILYKKGFYAKGEKDAKQYYKLYHQYRTKYTDKALIKFAKKWNKKGLSPKINEKGKISKKMWTALKNYNKI